MEKKCNKCKEVKPVSEFMKEARAKNGYKPRCKVCINEYDKIYYQKRKEKKIAQSKTYYNNNRDIILERVLKYRTKNRVKISQQRALYTKNRTEKDPAFRQMKLLRARVSAALRRNNDFTVALLGYSQTELYSYLGRKPSKGEAIDHKIPISWFMQNTDIRILFDIRNTQILTCSENTKKLNRYADAVPKDYFDIAIQHIKDKYKNKITYE